MITSLLLYFMAGCDAGISADGEKDHIAASTDGAMTSIPLNKTQGGSSFTSMTAEQSGIDFAARWRPTEKYKIMKAREFSGGGAAIGDVDGDGLADVYLSRPFNGGRLYRNLGDFRFEDVTESSGLAEDAWGAGCSFVDIDNDNDLDLYICGFDTPNRLFINDGAGRFADKAAEYGLDFSGASIMMSFADYDRDGDMDGYLVANLHKISTVRVGSQAEAEQVGRQAKVIGNRAVLPEELQEEYALIHRGGDQVTVVHAGQFNRLFRNDGSAFSEVSREAGVEDNGQTLAGIWWDFNKDGWIDLYVANDFYGDDKLFKNNGDGTFTNVLPQMVSHMPWASMGVDAGDLNNDGLIDLIGTDMSGSTHYKSKIGMGDMSEGWFLEYGEPRQYMRNAVFINTGTSRFMEAAHMTGMASTDWTWSPKIADFDCDGLQDVFITNGMSGDLSNTDLVEKIGHLPAIDMVDAVPLKHDVNIAFHNKGELKFDKVSEAWGLDHNGASYGAAIGDLDNDGDPDLVVNNFDEPVSVYRNDVADGHRIKVRLMGTVSNRYGVDAVVRIRTTSGVQVRQLTLARGFMSADEPVLFFGLGADKKIDELTVQWPSGIEQQFEDLEVDQFYTITEPVGEPKIELPREEEKHAMFAASPTFDGVIHQETPFDDFSVQPLLPNKLSQLGPAMAVGDVNGDGREDLIAGGAAGQTARLFMNEGRGFKYGRIKPFDETADREDMGIVLFDADNDGDRDLYIVSGGNEVKTGSDLLRDRLYLNDGNGAFEDVSAEALPDLRDSGGPVAAADFDQDGDVDLFIGGRVVPGEYPRTPMSRLLRNDSTDDAVRFTDVTESVASGLLNTGMVTAALWSDINNDGLLDLIVAHEWGPVKVFTNDEGQLAYTPGKSGMDKITGWWNGLVAGDVDNDGDLDLVSTNFGLNTKYHPTPKKPQLIYYGDFEKTGKYNIVEAKMTDGKLLPVRGKSCSQNAMPFVRKKFPTYHEFAISSLEDIYTTECLDDALKVEANDLRSGIWLNDGHGRFTFKSLPQIAQISPGFGVTLTDFNGDGNLDMALAQNFFTPQRETGRMDGGLGLLLLGDGTGEFDAIWPAESGIVVPGDAKSLLVMDINDDAMPDLIFGRNDDKAVAFTNRRSGNNKIVPVTINVEDARRLGARITAHFSDGTQRTHEVHATCGYLSQSSATLFIGTGHATISKLTIRWADGKMTEHQASLKGGHIVISNSLEEAN